MDYVHDANAQGLAIWMLTIMDNCTRRYLLIEVDISFALECVAPTLDNVMVLCGKPEALLTDNNTEFTGKALDE